MKLGTTEIEFQKNISNHSNGISINKINQKSNDIHKSKVDISEMTDEKGNPTEQAYQTAVNKLNEFMEHTQRNSKFIFHGDLERYYVEVVDAQTQEVVKEIPPKALLDAYYEMQKLAGKIFDTQA
ncbi:flagellar protein FlaG [Kurthia sp. 3B1D]|uniref:Flagellar protein FlaG n=1 Tax=Candidatus Kurthia intestinigallinarum TaxID=1562256 RepID=A0A433RTS4_9BACL|nr:flagellar protein FlaG [Kurthia sp. 3B1D]RUS55565.1 flagellar protein FlaG [Kurthia sp. 3B1D]